MGRQAHSVAAGSGSSVGSANAAARLRPAPIRHPEAKRPTIRMRKKSEPEFRLRAGALAALLGQDERRRTAVLWLLGEERQVPEGVRGYQGEPSHVYGTHQVAGNSIRFAPCPTNSPQVRVECPTVNISFSGKTDTWLRRS